MNRSFHLPDHEPMAHRRRVSFVLLAFASILFLIYCNSFDCGWHFDDEPNITQNPNLQFEEITWQNLKSAMYSGRNNSHVPYRPVACLSFALNFYFEGLSVFGYHLVNLLVHFIASVFLFLFIYHTLRLPSLQGKYDSDSYSIALLATVLWSINPIQTQAITYIVQRMASLAGMFYIITMYLYLRARTAEATRMKVLLLILSFLGFAMSLGSKENAAILPLSVFLYEVLLLQPNPTSYFRRNLTVLLVISTGIVLLGLAYSYLTGGGIFSFLSGYEERPFTLTQRLLTQFRIIILYISLLLYPMPNRLNIAHSTEVSTSLFDPVSTFFSMALIAGMITYAICSAKKRRLLSYCILFFFVNHIVESSIFPLELIFEHRNYIPSMLFFLPMTIGLSNLVKMYSGRRAIRYILSGFVILLLIGLGHSTYLRNFDWKNEGTLWSDAVEKSPNLLRAYHNLGKYYHDLGYHKKALSEYEKALEKPVANRIYEPFVTYYNVAKVHSDMRQYDKAKEFYGKAMELNPRFAPIYIDMAALIDREGQSELAYEYLLKAHRLDPHSVETKFNLGFHYLRENQPDSAIMYLQGLTKQKNFRHRVLLYLGTAYKQKGEMGRASTYFKMAKEENPRSIKAYLHLAEIYCRVGDMEKARQEASKAIELTSEENTFRQVIDHLLGKDHSTLLNPRAEIVMPLLSELCMQKSKVLKERSELLGELSVGDKCRHEIVAGNLF